MATDPVLVAALQHLRLVLQGSTDFNVSIINRAVDKLSLDASVTADASKHVSDIVPLVVSFLKMPMTEETVSTEIDYDPVVQLLDLVLSTVPGDVVLKDYLSMDDIIGGINSGLPALQRACMVQIARASPPDIVASTPLIDELVNIVVSPESDRSVANESIKALVALACDGELVRRKLFTGKCGSSLEAAINWTSSELSKNKGLTTVQCRVMSLITDIVPFDVSTNYVTREFLCLPPSSIDSDPDVLLVLNKLQFYRDLISNPHTPHLVDYIDDQVQAIARLYGKRRDDPDVASFLLNELFTFFGALSSVDPDRFAVLDSQHSITHSSNLTDFKSNHTIMFLSLLSPKYLASHLPRVVSEIPISAHTVRALRNFARNESCFNLLFNRPDVARAIARLPYYELMALLDAVSSKPYGIHKMLNSWSGAMNQLMWNEDVRDRDSVSFRREVFENLVHASPSQLGTWNEQIRLVYRALVRNIRDQDPAVAIMDKNA